MQGNNLGKLETLLKEEFLASKPFENSDDSIIIGIDIADIMKKASKILENGGFYIYEENANNLTPKKLKNHKICMLVASFDISKGASLEELVNNKVKVLEDVLDDDTGVIFSVKESDKENAKLLCFYQKNFFIKFANFKNERLEERKRRGINEYNPLLVVQKAHLEVQMHSNMLYSLLNPSGNHSQGDLFLKEFLKQCNIDESNFEDLKIYTEFNIESGRLDLYLKAKNFHIVIENKIEAGEREKQLERYADFLDSQSGEKYLIYLTLNGNEPSSLESWKIIENTIKKGDKELHYRQISYEKDILKWCENIKEKVKNIANLYHAIEFYTDVVKEITNQKENQMDILEFLKKENSAKTYSLALEILQQKEDVVAEFLKYTYNKTLTENNLTKDWEISNEFFSGTLKPKQTQDYYFAFCWKDRTNKDGGNFCVRIFGKDVEKDKIREEIANFLKIDKIDNYWSFTNNYIPFNNFTEEKISNFIIENYKKLMEKNEILKDYKNQCD